MNILLENNIPDIITLFKNNKVDKGYAFGSALTSDFNSASDFDFIIHFNNTLSPIEKGENWFNIYYGLKKILGRDIDLVREEDIKNPYLLNSINANKQLIYG
jgi:uncharacterized protein